MKFLIIPDIHETSFYKDYLNEDVDRIIFLGDYYDYHGKEPEGNKIDNFNFIMNFARTHNNVDVLIGNHDFSYISDSITNSYQYAYADKIKLSIVKNLDILKVAVEYNGIVFSHAGISKTFMKQNNFTSLEDLNKNLTNEIMGYNMRDYSGYGESIIQSPLWIRPESLMSDSAYPYQVVGHTALGNKRLSVKTKENKFIFSDTYEHNGIFILDENEAFKEADALQEVKITKVEIVQTKGGIFNLFITYDREFETKNPDAYSIYGFKTPNEALKAYYKLLDELEKEKIKVLDVPLNEEVIYF